MAKYKMHGNNKELTGGGRNLGFERGRVSWKGPQSELNESVRLETTTTTTKNGSFFLSFSSFCFRLAIKKRPSKISSAREPTFDRRRFRTKDSLTSIKE